MINGQTGNATAYQALNVPGQPRGFGYKDPVTGLQVWKASSAGDPSSGTSFRHAYSEGGAYASRLWNGDRYSVIAADMDSGGDLRVFDLVRGTGPTNYRALPVSPEATDLGYSFSRNRAGDARILYMLTAIGVQRVNTATNLVENTGNFPGPSTGVSGGSWFQGDVQDRRFVWMTGGSDVHVWDSQTNATLTRTFAGMDEPYLESDGRYVFVNNGQANSTLWDVVNDTVQGVTFPSNVTPSHVASLRGMFVNSDVNTGGGLMPTFRLAATSNSWTQFTDWSGYAPDYHTCGNWDRTEAELGGDLTQQYVLYDDIHETFAAIGSSLRESIGLMRLDGGDKRLVAHHYSTNFSNYWHQPHGHINPDGTLVIFASDMLGSSRVDLFAVELPLR